jgi:hypothetical protein
MKAGGLEPTHPCAGDLRVVDGGVASAVRAKMRDAATTLLSLRSALELLQLSFRYEPA